MPKGRRSKRTRRKPEPRNELLERLKELARTVGLTIREEKLHRELGYSVRSGLCRVDDAEVMLLDKNAAPQERIDALCAVLSEQNLDGVYVEPDLRRHIGGLDEAAVGMEAPATASPVAETSNAPDGAAPESAEAEIPTTDPAESQPASGETPA